MSNRGLFQWFVVVCLSFLLVACGADDKASQSDAAKKSTDTEQQAGSMMDDIKDSAAKAVESAENKMKEGVEAGKEALGDLADDAEEEIEEGMEALGEGAEETEDKLQGAMEQLK